MGSQSAPCQCSHPYNKDRELSSHFVACFRQLFRCGCLWYLCAFYGVNDVTDCRSVSGFVLMFHIPVLVDLHDLILCTVLVDVWLHFILTLCGLGEKFDEHCTFPWRMYLAIQLYIVVSNGTYSYWLVFSFLFMCNNNHASVQKCLQFAGKVLSTSLITYSQCVSVGFLTHRLFIPCTEIVQHAILSTEV